ncbi:MAG: hypothetical protein ACLUEQ_07950 [Cloacibacillus evryensis]
MLRQEPGQIEEFGRAIIALTENIRRCGICGAITDIDPCPICTDPLRNGKLLCIVESEEDCVAMEQAGYSTASITSSAAGFRRLTTKRYRKRASNACESALKRAASRR